MVRLALYATLPVLLTVSAAGLIAASRGAWALWSALAAGLVVIIVVWALQPDSGSFVHRFVAPVFLYLPPLALAGLILRGLGPSGQAIGIVTLVALGAAVLNLFLAPVFLTIGAVSGLWDWL